jgi:hypothetical protein
MLGVAFCWRSFRSMAVSIPKAAETGGRIAGPQVIDLKHCVCVCHGAISRLRWPSTGRSHMSNTEVQCGLRHSRSISVPTELTQKLIQKHLTKSLTRVYGLQEE